MDKSLKKRAQGIFARHMQESLPSFALNAEKSEYLFGSEQVWVDTTSVHTANLYIVFVPEHKGRNQFTVEIGWSTQRRFPHLIQRPSLAFKSDFSNCFELPEATTRLSYLMDADEWTQIDAENVEIQIAARFKDLLEYGVPFLKNKK